MSADVMPDTTTGLPVCSESCPSHDGKRCRVLGMRPDYFCEPALVEMRDELRRLLKANRKLDEALRALK